MFRRGVGWGRVLVLCVAFGLGIAGRGRVAGQTGSTAGSVQESGGGAQNEAAGNPQAAPGKVAGEDRDRQIRELQDQLEKERRFSLVQWILSGVGLLTSVIAVGLWVRRYREQRAWRRKEEELEGEITSQINDLDARIPKVSTRPELPVAAKRGPKFAVPQAAATKPVVKERIGGGKGKLPVRESPEEPPAPAAEVSLPPVALEAPMEQAAGEKATGDALADYAYAKSLGEEEGEDWFGENYTTQGLSCVNLNDHRLGTAALYFESDARGKFLMVEQGGRAVVLPGFGLDFVLGRGSLEGVFVYPAEVSGGLVLGREAEVERRGDRWTLQRAGEFGRG